MIDLMYPIGYIKSMSYLIQQTESFEKWHESVKDLRAKIAIVRRIERAGHGNLGDTKTLGSGISEMRIDVGAGYRIYFTVRERVIVILLVGGIKSSQQLDIKKGRAQKVS
jgi:putative addiction module killer protein